MHGAQAGGRALGGLARYGPAPISTQLAAVLGDAEQQAMTMVYRIMRAQFSFSENRKVCRTNSGWEKEKDWCEYLRVSIQ
jgi:hypothetical protein